MNTWYLNILRLYIFYQYVYLPRFKVYANMLYDVHKSKLVQDEYLTLISDPKKHKQLLTGVLKNIYPNKYHQIH